MRSPTFLSLCSAALALGFCGALVACGGDVVGMPIIPGSDALTADSGSSGGGDGGAASDASTDPPDAKPPNVPTELAIEVTVDTLGQNCMPAVMPDPVTASGRFKITNNGKTSAGPVTIKSAAFLDPTTKQIVALFDATASAPTIAPGASVETTFTKVDDSMTPANGCATLKCGESYLVALELTGFGVAAGTNAVSPAKAVGCVF